MSKQEFFKELKRSLECLDESLRLEICADIDAHFQEGLSQGLSEDDICRKLGQPGIIAEQFIEEHGSVSQVPVPEPIMQIDKAGLFGGSYYDINIDKSFTDVNNVNIKLMVNNLIIKPETSSQNFRVTIKGRSRYNMFTVENVAGQLSIIEKGPVIRFELFAVLTKLETTLWVPSCFNGDIRAKVSVGSINVGSVEGKLLYLKNSTNDTNISICRFVEYELHASAGNLTMENNAGNLDAQVSAGSVSINGHKGERVKVRASAGSVTMIDCDAEMDVHSSAGNVTINSENIALANIHAGSSAGNLRLDALETHSLVLSSSAGNVKAKVRKLKGETKLSSGAGNVTLKAWEVGGNIKADASAGSIKLMLPDGSIGRVEAFANMGGLKNNLRENPQSPYVVYAKSSIGSVKIEPV